VAILRAFEHIRALGLLVAACCLLLGRAAPGATSTDPIFDDPVATPATAPVSDPLEPANRVVFSVNQQFDHWFFDPVTRAYAFLVPTPARQAVRHVLANLDAPAVFVNDLLQLEPVDAGVTALRFVVNSTVGVAGLWDPAKHIGLEEHVSDFGQTLALCGIPSGPYLIFPITGPTTVRDGTGYLVDLLLRPTTYLFVLAPPAALVSVTGLSVGIDQGTVGIAARDEHAAELRALEASAMDYYAAMRSAYEQNRQAEIWTRREDRGPLALVRRALRALVPSSAGGEVGDAGAHGGDERLEAAALEH